MMVLKLFGIIFFCGLLSPSQEVLSGLSCAVSPQAMQNGNYKKHLKAVFALKALWDSDGDSFPVLSDAIIHNGLIHQHLQGLVVPNIMGEGSQLNSPTSITDLHLIKVRVPRLSVVLLPGIGVQLTIGAKLQLRGNCLVGLLSELIDILVEVNITANIKCTNFESGTFQVVTEDCLCILGAIKIKVLSGLLTLSVNELVLRQLTATLPALLCPVVDIVMNLVNIHLLSTLNAVIPVGTAGTIHYQLASIPYTSGKFLGLDLDGVVKQVGGSTIPHDSSPSALPPLMDRHLLLVMRQSFLNAVLSLLLQPPPQTFPCTPDIVSAAGPVFPARVTRDRHQPGLGSAPGGSLCLSLGVCTFSGASRLREAVWTIAPAGLWGCESLPEDCQSPAWLVRRVPAATSMHPQFPQCSACSGTSPLSIKLVLRGNPLILLEENKASVKLSVLIQLFSNRLDGSILNFLLLKADLALNVRVSIVGGRLVLQLALGSTSLSLESSDVGISNISPLKSHCISLLVETFLPVINGALSIGIPLPKVLRIPLVNVDFQIKAGMMVFLV
ncbi:BPI fold-containing family B member 4 [Lonchura striata]|uniref:BPI fold-containing family B member 4 n=1 Tax=Lonchura striata TaxID=40157 RepID=A0A218UTD8_9PASE|nr:BPI fold-containing family B member 4 [Lonchura striata domestica]